MTISPIPGYFSRIFGCICAICVRSNCIKQRSSEKYPKSELAKVKHQRIQYLARLRYATSCAWICSQLEFWLDNLPMLAPCAAGIARDVEGRGSGEALHPTFPRTADGPSIQCTLSQSLTGVAASHPEPFDSLIQAVVAKAAIMRQE